MGLRNSCVALTFHAVAPWAAAPSPLVEPAAARYAVGCERFAGALEAVRAESCCTAAEYVQKSSGDWRVLTFDDGLVTDYDIVLPMLLCRAVRATFFVTAECIGRPGYTSAAQLKEMAAAGMEIASHGLTHRYLVTMPRRDAIREIRHSKERIQEMVGVEVGSFAPVGGHFHRWMLAEAAEAGYRAFATMIPGRSRQATGLTVLRRNHVQSHHDAAYVSRLLRGHPGQLLLNRVRYSLLKLPKDLLGLGNYDALKDIIVGTVRNGSAGPVISRG